MIVVAPMISILTPCLDRIQFIDEAIQSVAHQDYPNVEHIIIDGGSTDGTLEVVRRFRQLRVITERDNGPYDALNKGLRLARGEIIGLLNSDDRYCRDVFGEVARRFAADPIVDIIFGGATVSENNGEGAPRTVARYVAPRDIELSFYNIMMGVPIINARFFRRHVFTRVGFFDTRYELAADREFLLRAAFVGTRSESISRLIYEYRKHDNSMSLSGAIGQRLKIYSEHMTIAEHYLRVQGVPVKVRRLLKFWHTREALAGLVLACRHASYRHAVAYGTKIWRHGRCRAKPE